MNTLHTFRKKIIGSLPLLALLIPSSFIFAEAIKTTLSNPVKYTNIYCFVQAVLGFAVQVGFFLAVFFIIFTGFKYVTARGNPAKVSEAHRMFLYTLIGTAVLLGAWGFAKAIEGTITQIRGSDTTIPVMDTNCTATNTDSNANTPAEEGTGGVGGSGGSGGVGGGSGGGTVPPPAGGGGTGGGGSGGGTTPPPANNSGYPASVNGCFENNEDPISPSGGVVEQQIESVPANSSWSDQGSYYTWLGPNYYNFSEAGKGLLSYTVTLPSAGDYYLQVRGKVIQNSIGFWVRANGAKWRRGFLPNTANTWALRTLIDTGTCHINAEFNLNAGVNTIEFSARDNGVSLDSFRLFK